MIGTLFKAFTLMGSEWVMWLLLGLSIISVAIILERMKSLSSQEKTGALLWKDQIEPWMKSGKLPVTSEVSADFAQKYPCLESGLLEVLVAASPEDSGDRKKSLELLMVSFLGRKKVELDRNLSFLGTLGSNAPFIGLFGTVLGIIKAFHELGETATSGGTQSISIGLSEALVATAVGLLVAIPAVVFFNFYQRKIKMIVSRAESLGNFVISMQR